MKKTNSLFLYCMILLSLFILVSCNINEEKNEKDENIEINLNQEEKITSINEPAESDKTLSQSGEFIPHYTTVFKLEKFEEINRDEWPENVISLYQDVNNEFNYKIFKTEPLYYIGNYEADDKYLEEFLDLGINSNKTSVYKNIEAVTYDNSNYYFTLLKAYSINKRCAELLDEYISVGRNFEEKDFQIESKNEEISILLGDSYKENYNIGDILVFGEPGMELNYKVIGFIEKGTEIISDYDSSVKVNFDNYIVLPHYIPKYEPKNEIENFEIIYQICTSLDGYIEVENPNNLNNEELFDDYEDKLIKICKRYNLDDFVGIAYKYADLRID